MILANMNIFVYPEYFDPRKLSGQDIEVFATLTRRRSRMSLHLNGVEKCSYEKILPDKKCEAGPADQRPAMFLHGTVVMGLLCCRDIDNHNFVPRLKEELVHSGLKNRVIVVSAEMNLEAGWSASAELNGFQGFTVILSNGGHGIPSFVASVDGKKSFNSLATIAGMTFHIKGHI
jgi:hypothetical protein